MHVHKYKQNEKKNDTENLFRNDDGHFHSKAQLKSHQLSKKAK